MNDTVELARRYVTGLTLKRGETMTMVKELLEMLDKQTVKFDVSKVPAPPGEESPLVTVKNGYQEVLAGLMLTLEKEAPNLRVTVSRTPEGAVFVGPDVNRTYSAAEAKALAGRLYREATVK